MPKIFLKESDIQRQILDWLKANKVWHRRLHTQGIITGGGRRAKNPMIGMGDILFLVPGTQGRLGCIEVKSLKGPLSEIQKQIHIELIHQGVLVIIARSLEDVSNILR